MCTIFCLEKMCAQLLEEIAEYGNSLECSRNCVLLVFGYRDLRINELTYKSMANRRTVRIPRKAIVGWHLIKIHAPMNDTVHQRAANDNLCRRVAFKFISWTLYRAALSRRKLAATRRLIARDNNRSS